MSCPAGSLQGFPVALPNNAFTMVSETAGENDPNKLWNVTGREFDFSVNWSPSTTPWPVTISRSSDNTLRNNRYFYVSGFDTIANGTTLTYAGVSYICDPAFAICNVQHEKLIYPAFVSPSNQYPYEAILAFRIQNQFANPSAPQLILLCQPFQFRENFNVPGWSGIQNKALKPNESSQSTFHPKQLFMWQDDLSPMVSYETCINIQRTQGNVSRDTNFRVKVCVGIIPKDLPLNTEFSAKCADIARYRFRFDSTSLFDYDTVQIKQTSFGAYPSPPTDNYFPISIDGGLNGESVLNYFQVLVPQSVFGQDPGAITSGTAQKVKKALKPTKCYRVDTAKDIRNGEIKVDPTTGQSVSDMLTKEAIDNAGGDPELALALQGKQPENPGILPGDVQQGLLITGIVLGSVAGAALMFYVLFLLFYRKDYKNAATYGAGLVVALILLIVTSVIFAQKEEKK